MIEKYDSVRRNILIKFLCASPTVISSMFPFPYFVLSILPIIPVKLNVQYRSEPLLFAPHVYFLTDNNAIYPYEGEFLRNS